MKMVAPPGKKKVWFEIAEAVSESALGFDPASFSEGGNATCPFCGTVADLAYVKSEGMASRMGQQLMAIACSRHGSQGKVYIAGEHIADAFTGVPKVNEHLEKLANSQITGPTEPLPKQGTLGFRVRPYGLKTWGDLFNLRQTASLLTFTAAVQDVMKEMNSCGYDSCRSQALATFLALLVDRLADFNSVLCVFNYTGGRGVVHTFGRHALPMVWDYAESNPFNPAGASWISGVEDVPAGLKDANFELFGEVRRGSATTLNLPDKRFDAIVTDPPYYDNVPYADLSDFFYVWLKRTIGPIYPEHFATELTPKKLEAIAEPVRHDGSVARARQAYETMMQSSFQEAHRVLKPGGQLVVVYAHKTTLGWATLIDALRVAGFMVTEAWPLDTEKPGRLRAQQSAALASSINLVARKRDAGDQIGKYDDEVRPELEAIVRERVETLWNMQVAGADLVLACVGGGLRAFTRFVRVEYANGEEVPAQRFLAEVETVVLDTVLQKLSKIAGGNGSRARSLAGLDQATRFYILWRYTYGWAELDAGEGIIFANGTHVELDGPLGLSTGSRALVEKKKGKYKLRDFADRGDDDRLGLPDEDTAESRAAIDVLHRLLWLLENRPPLIPDFIADAQPNLDQLRLVAQALAGPALKGGELENVSPTGEQSALGKLLANWSTVMEGKAAREDRRVGQQSLGI